MKRVVLRAPAKVNLGLRILARRADGYHELESVFAPLDLADEIELELAEGKASGVVLELREGADGVPTDAANLAVRAAQAFLGATGLRCGVRIQLDKRVPVAAGLGGGSSDAGAVLHGLSTLRPDAVAPEALRRLALSLGADVPFFLDPQPALVSGIGERSEPVPTVAGLTLLLANPGLPVSTAGVYDAFDALHPALTERAGPSTLRPLLGRWAAVTPPKPDAAPELRKLLANDLEAAAVRLCPPIGRLRRQLEQTGAVAVGMSGSGATLFGVYEDAAGASAAGRRLAAAVQDGGGPPVWCRVAMTTRTR